MDLFASDDPDGDVGDPQVPGPGPTPPRVRAPRTSDGLGLDDWDVPVPGSGSGSRRWLLVAAALPWVVVVAVLVTGERVAAPAAVSSGDATSAATGAPSPVTAPVGTTSPAETAAPPAPDATSDHLAPVALDGTTGPTALGAARGLALVVARSWLSTRPAGPAVDGLTPAAGADIHYVEHLVVESIDHPAPGALVVALRAVVLPVEGDRYGTAEQLLLAVPIELGADGARPAGTPWRLPLDTPALNEPATSPIDDPDLQLAAVDAVVAAGYRDVDLSALSRTSGWAWVADVTARAPGEDDRGAHRIWLRSDVGRLVVAGTSAPPRAAPPTATAPSPSASPRPTDQESAS